MNEGRENTFLRGSWSDDESLLGKGKIDMYYWQLFIGATGTLGSYFNSIPF